MKTISHFDFPNPTTDAERLALLTTVTVRVSGFQPELGTDTTTVCSPTGRLADIGVVFPVFTPSIDTLAPDGYEVTFSEPPPFCATAWTDMAHRKRKKPIPIIPVFFQSGIVSSDLLGSVKIHEQFFTAFLIFKNLIGKVLPVCYKLLWLICQRGVKDETACIFTCFFDRIPLSFKCRSAPVTS